MSVVQTVMIFVALPAALYAVLAVLVYTGGGRRGPRYRPGRGWDHRPVWYLPRSAATPHAPGHAVSALTGRATVDTPVDRNALGGASGTW